MSRRTLSTFVLFVFILALAAPALAQQSGTVYVRVELWDVKREQWPAFVKNFEKYDQPVYEKLFKEGVINEWGIDGATLHNPEGYTHGVWHSSTSMEAFEKVQDAFDAAYKALGEKEQARVEAEFAGMLIKHRDYMIRQDFQKAKGVSLHKAYYYEASTAVNRGQEDNYVSYWNEYIKPTYQKLMDEGTIVAYGRSREEITTDAEDRRTSWYVVGDLTAHQKVQAALSQTWERLTGEQQRARWASIWEFATPGTYREYMSRLVHWAIKEQ